MKNRPIGVLVDALRKLGANVEYIDKEAFFRLKHLEEMPYFPNLKYIGDQAFERSGIKKVELSDTVEYIGLCAFSEIDLEEISIPSGVKYISGNAFCDTPWIDNQTGFVIEGDNILISYPNEETVVIPVGVKSIGLSRWEHTKVRKIYVPSTITNYDNCFIASVKQVKKAL